MILNHSKDIAGGKPEMNEWKSKFSTKIDALRDSASQRFERFAANVLEDVHGELVEFATRHEFECSTPQAQSGGRMYKFALTEDGFVLVYFKTQGIASVAFSYECYLPGQGRSATRQQTRELATADGEWVENCFQESMDAFVDAFSKCDASIPEPAYA